MNLHNLKTLAKSTALAHKFDKDVTDVCVALVAVATALELITAPGGTVDDHKMAEIQLSVMNIAMLDQLAVRETPA